MHTQDLQASRPTQRENLECGTTVSNSTQICILPGTAAYSTTSLLLLILVLTVGSVNIINVVSAFLQKNKT